MAHTVNGVIGLYLLWESLFCDWKILIHITENDVFYMIIWYEPHWSWSSYTLTTLSICHQLTDFWPYWCSVHLLSHLLSRLLLCFVTAFQFCFYFFLRWNTLFKQRQCCLFYSVWWHGICCLQDAFFYDISTYEWHLRSLWRSYTCVCLLNV